MRPRSLNNHVTAIEEKNLSYCLNPIYDRLTISRVCSENQKQNLNVASVPWNSYMVVYFKVKKDPL